MSTQAIRQYLQKLKMLSRHLTTLDKGTVLALAGSALVAVALLVSIGHQSKTAKAFVCTSNPCPYDEKTGEFIGYPKPWPPNCVYIIPGLPGTESGKATSTGNYKFNQNDRTAATTALPQCYPEDVSKYGLTYYGRGHRMYNVGTYIDRTGFAYKYNADGSFLAAVCMVPEKCGTQNLTGAAGETAAAGAAAGATDPATAKNELTDPTGWLDSASCDGIKGWVFDTSNVGTAMTVHVYVDGKAGASGKLLTSGTTTENRDDINKAFSVTGTHGFAIALPDSVRDNKSHSVYVYGIDTDGGTNLLLGGGGKTFTCTGTTGVTSTNPTAVPVVDTTTPVGWFDVASCNQLTGWALDPDNATAVVAIHFYKDGPAGKGVLFGDTTTTVQRDDINTLYKTTGTHGFVYRFNSVLGNPLADNKPHAIYAYAINTNGGTNPALGGSPKSVTCTGSATTPPPSGGGGAGGSNRHNYLTPCDGAGIAGKNDPAIVIEVKADGTIVGSIDTKNVPDAVVKINGTVTTDKNFTLKSGDSISVTTKNGTYSADADGLAKGENASILVPMPCIRIGYDDIFGGQQCGEGESGTCADELDAFINVESIQAAGLKDSDYEIWYKVKGGKYDTGGWKKYDWKNCGQYSNHCIRLAGAGVIYAKTKVISGDRPGSWSLTTQKEFDVAKGKF